MSCLERSGWRSCRRMNAGHLPRAFLISPRPSTDAWHRGNPAPSVPKRRLECLVSAIGRNLVDFADEREVAFAQPTDVVSGHLDPDRAVIHDEVGIMVRLFD